MTAADLIAAFEARGLRCKQRDFFPDAELAVHVSQAPQTIDGVEHLKNALFVLRRGQSWCLRLTPHGGTHREWSVSSPSKAVELASHYVEHGRFA